MPPSGADSLQKKPYHPCIPWYIYMHLDDVGWFSCRYRYTIHLLFRFVTVKTHRFSWHFLHLENCGQESNTKIRGGDASDSIFGSTLCIGLGCTVGS